MSRGAMLASARGGRMVLGVLVALAVALPSAGMTQARPSGLGGAFPRSNRDAAPFSPPHVASADPAELLAHVSDGGAYTAAGTYSSISFTFTMSGQPMPSDGQSWDLGNGLFFNVTGVTDFTGASDSDFSKIATLLTDGINEWIELGVSWPPGGGGGLGSSESNFLGTNPDLIGYEVDFVRLNITTLSFSTSGGYTTANLAFTWEIWGHPLFVYFVPPTDPDGAYLVDRNETNVSVGLAGPGTPTLEWNGVNRSMPKTGANYSVDLRGLANGVYAYRVWATNTTGAVFATPTRMLTVGVGLWTLEHLGYGFWPSLAFNASGEPRLCYYGAPGLVYAARTPLGWTNVSLAGGGDTGELCSLALDSHGHPHIAYNIGPSYSGGFQLGYATFNGTTWSTTIVDNDYYTTTSIAINPVTDEPMISYADVRADELKLATLSGGVWSTQVVDPSFYGEQTSLAISPSGNPAIAYPDYTSGTLRVASWTGSAWVITTLATYVTAASIAFDAAGGAHVAYGTPEDLRYATWNGTGWSTETVDAGRYYSVSLGFDPQGRPHIGYAMGWGGDVREAVWDGTWTVQVITHKNGNGNGGADLAPMPDGSAGAVFELNDTNGDLVFATDYEDHAPPYTVALLNGTAGSHGWFRSNVTVTLVAQDNWSAIASTAMRVDGGTWTNYTGPFVLATEGVHLIQYRSTDAASNVEPTVTTAVEIDATPPVVVATPTRAPTAAGWYNASVTVALSTTDPVSGYASVTYELDNGPWMPYLGPFRVETQGQHDVRYFAVDYAGNAAVTKTLSINIDDTPPEVVFEGVPATITSTTFAVQWIGTDPLSGIAGYEISVDGGAFQSLGSTSSMSLTLVDGPHTVTVRATDAAGNRATATARLVVDTNVLSFSGPTHGLLTSALIAVAATALAALMLRRRRRQGPSEPHPPPSNPPKP